MGWRKTVVEFLGGKMVGEAAETAVRAETRTAASTAARAAGETTAEMGAHRSLATKGADWIKDNPGKAKALGWTAKLAAGAALLYGAASYIFNTRGSPEDALRRPAYDKQDEMRKKAFQGSGEEIRDAETLRRARLGIQPDLTPIAPKAGTTGWGLGDETKGDVFERGGRKYVTITPTVTGTRLPSKEVTIITQAGSRQVAGTVNGNSLEVDITDVAGPAKIELPIRSGTTQRQQDTIRHFGQ